MRGKLAEEIRRLHNPDAEKTARLFRDYANVDVVTYWKWANFEPHRAREQLNDYMKLRGDVVHRSRPLAETGPPKAHPVTKDDLRKAIRFLRDLVEATQKALVAQAV